MLKKGAGKSQSHAPAPTVGLGNPNPAGAVSVTVDDNINIVKGGSNINVLEKQEVKQVRKHNHKGGKVKGFQTKSK